MTPRPAATVVLARPAASGPEVLLLQRPRRSAFAPGAWVFPGGVVDEGDAAAGLLEAGEAGRWAARLGLDDPAEASGYVVAALREAWEETGILLSREPVGEGARAARAQLLAGRCAFAALVEGAGARLSTHDLLYLAHWITPETEPRRYDTRFFLARVPADAVCEPHAEEMDDARWLRPDEALEGFAGGAIALLPPTAHTLRRLAPFHSLEAAWEALRDAPVPTYLPRLRPGGGGMVLVEV